MTRVTVYQTPACVQCMQSKKVLDKGAVPYDVVDLSQHPESMEMVKALGYTQAPVIVVTDREGKTSHWSGFRLEKLNALVTKFQGAASA